MKVDELVTLQFSFYMIIFLFKIRLLVQLPQHSK